MTFALPMMLTGLGLLPIALAAYGFAQRRRSRYAVRFTNVDLLTNLVPERPAWRRHLPPALYFLASAALIVALARPSATIPVPREDATVLLALDVSGSMRATDVEPDRLTAAKAAANDFLAVLPPGMRVGLISFSSDAGYLAGVKEGTR
jgi:Ca-activated chloride channel homolog